MKYVFDISKMTPADCKKLEEVADVRWEGGKLIAEVSGELPEDLKSKGTKLQQMNG